MQTIAGSIQLKQVTEMKTLLNARLFRNTLLSSAAAASLMTVPMLADASVQPNKEIHVGYNSEDLATIDGQLSVYQKMKTASRKLCGSSNLRIAGSLAQAKNNTECYEGTLTAAVARLGSESVSKLHKN